MEYWRKGWYPLPLPTGQKAPPPSGFTGYHPPPTLADVERWLETEDEKSNIGIRVPDGIIGIDVDAYPPKKGGASLQQLTERLGALPPSWTLSARADGISGIRFFTIPKGKHWPGDIAPDIQIVQFRYRFAVAAPSRHPKIQDGVYKWYPPGVPIDGRSWVPEIPDVTALTGALEGTA
jgi:hypothetical protein